MAGRAKPRGFNDIRPFVQPVSAPGPSDRLTVVRVPVASDVMPKLWQEAYSRDITPGALAAEIVEVVLRDGLVKAVLDK